ncbi:MAG: hypothetical protein CMM44_06505 [Rhodospirillaceae bacterium]|nr:hypothetical protein [Rhodospirillaceae bacterium]
MLRICFIAIQIGISVICFNSSIFAQNVSDREFEVIDRFIEVEQFEEAIAKLKKIEPRSNTHAAKINLRVGRIFLKLNKPLKALEFFERANFSMLEDAQISVDLGRAYLSLGNFAKARKYAKSAIKINPALLNADLLFAKIDEVSGST